ncbi:14967_t:CDS:2 [Funneliformis geosporum]|uniref:14967_t:CDS:1 n=1 Tax=Funneliformis geosporum TaxID=1117311 RepID=A0A9W4SIV2_9GLOM|nr:14967_t:CDS:2 [Funneliformis geosporum]
MNSEINSETLKGLKDRINELEQSEKKLLAELDDREQDIIILNYDLSRANSQLKYLDKKMKQRDDDATYRQANNLLEEKVNEREKEVKVQQQIISNLKEKVKEREEEVKSKQVTINNLEKKVRYKQEIINILEERFIEREEATKETISEHEVTKDKQKTINNKAKNEFKTAPDAIPLRSILAMLRSKSTYTSKEQADVVWTAFPTNVLRDPKNGKITGLHSYSKS